MIFERRFYMRLIAMILTAFCLFSCASLKAAELPTKFPSDTNGQAAAEASAKASAKAVAEAVTQNAVELMGVS
jgi:hypothetical protein